MTKPLLSKTSGLTPSKGVKKADAEIQSDRFIAKARELGLDEREETFDAALKKVARHKPSDKAVEPTDD